MEIEEITNEVLRETPLESFSRKKFHLEVTGFELLAIYIVSRFVGGISNVREVFSAGSTSNNFDNKIIQIEGAREAYAELRNKISISGVVKISDE